VKAGFHTSEGAGKRVRESGVGVCDAALGRVGKRRAKK
jgi:hypothetical protein